MPRPLLQAARLTRSSGVAMGSSNSGLSEIAWTSRRSAGLAVQMNSKTGVSGSKSSAA